MKGKSAFGLLVPATESMVTPAALPCCSAGASRGCTPSWAASARAEPWQRRVGAPASPQAMPLAAPRGQAAVQQLGSQNSHRFRRVDPQAHLAALNGYHSQMNPRVDCDTLADLARENERHSS